ncbi:MAG: hypothetical protein KAI67_05830 [Candidatus Pacebacteria bacterium]|nr:hypothetical protein [Candidatus Paceibacterota bacterium]
MKNNSYIAIRKMAAFRVMPFFCIIFLFFVFVNTETKAVSISENEEFLVDSAYDYFDRFQVQASLQKISLNAYFYVENDYYNSLSGTQKNEFDLSLDLLASDFDNIIYPKMRNIFGMEWDPGIDNDSKITILFTRTKENVGGYFNPNDEYSKDVIVNKKSNEREMIYLNISFIDDERIKSFLAHEFQHMITWYNKNKLNNISDNIWLNEARSEYASTAIGYDDDFNVSNLKARISGFKTNPVDSITEWQNKIYDYSSVNLFSQYLVDQFGGNIFRIMISNDKIGIESINDALLALNQKETFRSVFENWSVANYLNDTTVESNGKYGYKNANINYENFHISTQNQFIIDSSEVNISNSIKDWTGEYYEFKLIDRQYGIKDKIKISFEGEVSGKYSVPCVVFYKNGEKSVEHLILGSNQNYTNSISLSNNNISSFTIIPVSYKNSTSFGSDIDDYNFSLSVDIVNNSIFANNSLLKSNNNSKVYLVDGNNKRWIDSVQSFVLNGYDWKDIVIVTDYELSQYQNGEDIVAVIKKYSSFNGSLFRNLNDSKVYLIEDNKKRWIDSVQSFVLNGYDWKNIVIVTEYELNQYQNGVDVS